MRRSQASLVATLGVGIILTISLCLTQAAQAWQYRQNVDPFDQRPPIRMGLHQEKTPWGMFSIGVLRAEGNDIVRLAFILPDDHRLDSSKDFFLRIDQHSVQDFERCSVFDPNGGATTRRYSAPLTDGVECSANGANVELAVIDIDDVSNTEPITGDQFYYPRNAFLRHLIDGTTLYFRYTDLKENEITVAVSLIGITRVLVNVIEKTAGEVCTDSAIAHVAVSGCLKRAVDAAQPWNGPGPVFDSPKYKAIAEPCFAEARKVLPACQLPQQ